MATRFRIDGEIAEKYAILVNLTASLVYSLYRPDYFTHKLYKMISYNM